MATQNQLMDLPTIQQKLEDRNLAIVADRCGMHYNTLHRIANGKTKNPGYQALKTISEYLNHNKD